MKLLNEVNCPFGGSIINRLVISNFYISAQVQYKSWLRVWRLPGPRRELQAHSQTKQEEIEFLHGEQVCKLGYSYTLHSFGWLWSWRHWSALVSVPVVALPRTGDIENSYCIFFMDYGNCFTWGSSWRQYVKIND